MTIRVKATANVFGLRRGDVVDLDESEIGPTLDALIEQGYLTWLNPPPAEPEYTLTEVVKARKPRAKKVDEALEAELAAWDEASLGVPIDYTQFPEPTDDVWSDDGGSTPA